MLEILWLRRLPLLLLALLSWGLRAAAAADPYPLIALAPAFQLEALDPQHRKVRKLRRACHLYQEQFAASCEDEGFFHWVDRWRSFSSQSSRVHCFSEVEIQQAWHRFGGGRLPASAPTGQAEGEFLYVMTGDGSFYLYDPAFPRADGRTVNHASFFCFQPVAAAGTVTLALPSGRLLRVDNRSGHYRPGWAELGAVLRELRDQGQRLAGVQLEYLRRTGGTKEVRTLDARSALREIDEPADEAGIRGMSRADQAPYQDIWVDGRTLSGGRGQPCAERYDKLQPYLQRLAKEKADLRLLDVGAAQGYFGLRIAGDFPQAHVHMVDKEPFFRQVAARNPRLAGRVVLTQTRLTPWKLRQLPADFDVVLALNILHHFPRCWEAMLEAVVQRGRVVFVELPPIGDEASRNQPIVRALRIALAEGGFRGIAQWTRRHRQKDAGLSTLFCRGCPELASG